MHRASRLALVAVTVAAAVSCSLSAQSTMPAPPPPVVRHAPPPIVVPGVVERLQQRVDDLERRIAVLEAKR